jgi:hypothetical protein
LNEYEQKKQERIDRLREKASKARAQSDALSRQSWDMISAIPSGQPVMGAADARYRERAGNKMRQSVAASDKADYYERRAQAAENNTAISSDDPEAIAKLTEKLEELKQTQEFMKAVNAYYKKNGTCQGFPGLSDEEAAKLESGMEYHPWDRKTLFGNVVKKCIQCSRTSEKRNNIVKKFKYSASYFELYTKFTPNEKDFRCGFQISYEP